jgi:hypothetical protein
MSFHALPKQVHQWTLLPQAEVCHQFCRLQNFPEFLTKVVPQQALAPVVGFCHESPRRLVKEISFHALPRKVLQQIMIQESPVYFLNPHRMIYDREVTNKVHSTRENSGVQTCFVNHPGT